MSPATGSTAFVGALVALVARRVDRVCGDQTGTTANGADVPPPAIAVTGDPAAISGASDGIADDAAGIDTVVMIGDSITKGATPALDERYELLGLDHLIEAQNGKRIAVSSPDNASGVSIAQFLADNGDGDHTDEVWVVALGTNDVGQYASPDEIAAVVNEILAAVPDDAALVWVDTTSAIAAEAAAELNAIVRDRVARRGDSVIAPWSVVRPERGRAHRRRRASHERRRRRLRLRGHRHRARLPRPLTPPRLCCTPGGPGSPVLQRKRCWVRCPSGTGRSGSRPSAPSGSGWRVPRRAWLADAARGRRPCGRRRSTRSPTHG